MVTTPYAYNHHQNSIFLHDDRILCQNSYPFLLANLQYFADVHPLYTLCNENSELLLDFHATTSLGINLPQKNTEISTSILTLNTTQSIWIFNTSYCNLLALSCRHHFYLIDINFETFNFSAHFQVNSFCLNSSLSSAISNKIFACGNSNDKPSCISALISSITSLSSCELRNDS